jgi:3-hydroxypropanoate dehydrogenase
MTEASHADLELLFTEARSHNGWKDLPVSDELLTRVYDLMKWGPTTTNCCPARILFIRTPQAKEKLKATLAAGNVEKSMTAPVVAVIAHDLEFYKKLDILSPKNKARTWYEGEGKEKLIHDTAFRNGSLQGAYFMLAARALGLDCGPMGGFDNAKLDEAFFAGTAWKSNFICALGYGDPARLYPRAARLPVTEACRFE